MYNNLHCLSHSFRKLGHIRSMGYFYSTLWLFLEFGLLEPPGLLVRYSITTLDSRTLSAAHFGCLPDQTSDSTDQTVSRGSQKWMFQKLENSKIHTIGGTLGTEWGTTDFFIVHKSQ